MSKRPENIIGEYDQLLSGTTALMVYHMSHFCVKADPTVLLSMEAETLLGPKNLEEVCTISLIDDYTFCFMPLNKDLTADIIKAVLSDHPEFKVERVLLQGDDVLPYDSKYEDDGNYVKAISARVPDVDKDRRDAIFDGIKVIYDNCKARFAELKGKYLASLNEASISYDPSSLKIINDKFDETDKTYQDMRDKMYADKQTEVEDAYQEYCKRHESELKQKEKEDKARGVDVTQGLNMFNNNPFA